jgi:hypothetical protein
LLVHFLCVFQFSKNSEQQKFFHDGTAYITLPNCTLKYLLTPCIAYTLYIHSNFFPIYHASKLKPHHANDSIVFPSHTLTHLGPIVTEDGLEEYIIDQILNSHCRGHSWKFLVHWAGYTAKHNLWIAVSKLNECEALDKMVLSGWLWSWHSVTFSQRFWRTH